MATYVVDSCGKDEHVEQFKQIVALLGWTLTEQQEQPEQSLLQKLIAEISKGKPGKPAAQTTITPPEQKATKESKLLPMSQRKLADPFGREHIKPKLSASGRSEWVKDPEHVSLFWLNSGQEGVDAHDGKPIAAYTWRACVKDASNAKFYYRLTVDAKGLASRNKQGVYTCPSRAAMLARLRAGEVYA